MTDSRGDVCIHLHLFGEGVLIIVFRWPTSWLMSAASIQVWLKTCMRDSRAFHVWMLLLSHLPTKAANTFLARIMTRILYWTWGGNETKCCFLQADYYMVSGHRITGTQNTCTGKNRVFSQEIRNSEMRARSHRTVPYIRKTQLLRKIKLQALVDSHGVYFLWRA